MEPFKNYKEEIPLLELKTLINIQLSVICTQIGQVITRATFDQYSLIKQSQKMASTLLEDYRMCIKFCGLIFCIFNEQFVGLYFHFHGHDLDYHLLN